MIYPLPSVTNLNVKSAFLIIAHGNFDMLRFLIESLDDKAHDIYVHIDKKCGEVDYCQLESITRYSHVKCVRDRIRVYWGGVSIIKSTFKLLREAARGEYTYYHLISGVDFPIMSNQEIYDFLCTNRGKEFVGFTTHDHDLARKLRYYHLFVDSKYGQNRFVQRIDSFIKKLQRVFHFWQFRDVKQFAKGCNWFSITHSLVKEILSEEKSIIRRYRFSFAADEVFLQTFIKQHPEWKERLFCTTSEYEGCMRLIDWDRGTPYTYTLNDIDELVNSKRFFARKIANLEVMKAIAKNRK